MKILIDTWVVFTTMYVIADIYDEWQARKRYKRFEARCQKRLAEMLAVKRDPYDGRPV